MHSYQSCFIPISYYVHPFSPFVPHYPFDKQYMEQDLGMKTSSSESKVKETLFLDSTTLDRIDANLSSK